jgi:hypothetical protein
MLGFNNEQYYDEFDEPELKSGLGSQNVFIQKKKECIDRFEKGPLLARGARGTVYSARDLLNGNLCVMRYITFDKENGLSDSLCRDLMFSKKLENCSLVDRYSNMFLMQNYRCVL